MPILLKKKAHKKKCEDGGKIKSTDSTTNQPASKKKLIGNLGKDNQNATKLSSGGFGKSTSISKSQYKQNLKNEKTYKEKLGQKKD